MASNDAAPGNASVCDCKQSSGEQQPVQPTYGSPAAHRVHTARFRPVHAGGFGDGRERRASHNSVPLLRFHTGSGERCLSEINATQRAQEERVADTQGKRGRRKGREGGRDERRQSR
ncbi:hypothetical protein EYF80_034015 [Liparis tanakae]|uniref:Uncharacterized protein n=1 Tax=Liparis tanakae TaxID=230148 RepID=A0A4Z2GQB7_9TELE|nr:hypothetical protein EYF80_034015 [Liparis tanakae]